MTCVILCQRGNLGKAVSYAKSMRPYVDRFVGYGEIDFSNNHSERNMKSFVMGRKNYQPRGFASGLAGLTQSVLITSRVPTVLQFCENLG